MPHSLHLSKPLLTLLADLFCFHYVDRQAVPYPQYTDWRILWHWDGIWTRTARSHVLKGYDCKTNTLFFIWHRFQTLTEFSRFLHWTFSKLQYLYKGMETRSVLNTSNKNHLKIENWKLKKNIWFLVTHFNSSQNCPPR